MATGIYARVSSRKQDQASQMPDLERYAKTLAAEGEPVEWYRDTLTGKTMERPGWRKLEEAIRSGQVDRVVVWRLDRLGRTASGLTALFEELIVRKINLVSIRDGVDLATPAGRLMAGVLASVAQYETEVRAERTMAGQAVAREKGVHMGRPPGKHTPIKVTDLHRAAILDYKARDWGPSAIARVTGLSRGTVYSVLAAAEPGLYLVFSGVKGQLRPVYAVRAPGQTEARQIAAGQHPAGTRLQVKPDDGTAARLKLVVLVATVGPVLGDS